MLNWAISWITPSFAEMPKTLMIPEIPTNSFAKKLYSTYLSYLPKEKAIFDLKMNKDDRGSFTELIHTLNCGQVSINISKPGITKGQHWHHTKWEQFIVVSGHGLIQLRNENVVDGELLIMRLVEITFKALLCCLVTLIILLISQSQRIWLL